MKIHVLGFLLISGLIIGACSSKVSKPSFQGKDVKPADDDAEPYDPTSGDTESAGPLQLIPDAGSKMRFMNGEALTAVFGRVFKPTADGYAHCQKTKTKDFEGCNVMFTTDERASVGLFDLYSQRMNRGVQNVARPENLTLNYMRNIRAALGRECERLTTNEEKAAGDAETILVKANGPTAASIQTFFEKLMGAEGAKIDFAVPYASFAEAYKTAIEMDTDKAKASHNAYVNLCIALAIDPQVFIY